MFFKKKPDRIEVADLDRIAALLREGDLTLKGKAKVFYLGMLQMPWMGMILAWREKDVKVLGLEQVKVAPPGAELKAKFLFPGSALETNPIRITT